MLIVKDSMVSINADLYFCGDLNP